MAITYNTAIERIACISQQDSAGNVTVINYAGAAFDYFKDTDTADAAIYFLCLAHRFSGLEFDIGTAITATDLVLVWEYYKYDGTWVALSGVTDGTAGFTNTGVRSVTWTVPTDWAASHCLWASSVPRYYLTTGGFTVRCRISSVTSLSEGGRNNATKVKDFCNGIYIGDGGSYTLDNIVTADVAGGWGVLTKDSNTRNYFLNCNLLIHNGTLTIDGYRTLTVGKTAITSTTGSASATDGQMIEVLDDGVLTLGSLNANGLGYNGAKVVWNGCARQLDTSRTGGRFSGTFNAYASQFYFSGLGSMFSHLMGRLNLVDSVVESFARTSWSLSTNVSGEIIRSSINTSNLYIYTPALIFDSTAFGVCTAGTAWQFVLSGADASRIKNSNLNGTVSLSITQLSTMDVVDCINIPTKTSTGNYAQYECINEMYTFALKVLDENNTPIENATVTLTDKNGYTALFEDYFNWNGGTKCYIWNLTSTSDTNASVTSSTNITVGEYFLAGGEIMKVTAKPSSTTVRVERNQVGTWKQLITSTSEGRTPLYRLNTSALTNSAGELKNNTSYDYMVFIEQLGRINNVATTYTFNPFTLTISKDGYETYTATFDITERTELIIKLKTAIKLRPSIDYGDLYLAADAENGSSAKLIKI